MGCKRRLFAASAAANPMPKVHRHKLPQPTYCDLPTPLRRAQYSSSTIALRGSKDISTDNCTGKFQKYNLCRIRDKRLSALKLPDARRARQQGGPPRTHAVEN